MNKLLIYLDSLGAAHVIESTGEQANEILIDIGSAFEEWPDDLTVYDQGVGLLLWEGEIEFSDSDGYSFKGELRDLNEVEWSRLRRHQGVFDD